MRTNAIRRTLQPKSLLSGLSAGLVIGIINITIEISLAALIFSGPLVVFLSNGIGMMLAGALIFMVIIGLTSSLHGIIAGPQDSPAAILALAAVAITQGIPTGSAPESIFATIVVTIAISSILAGLFFLLLGQFRSGNLVRFIPYPVVGGFLAGTGWLLVKGGLSVMGASPLSFSLLPRLFSLEMLGLWLPGVILGAVLVWTARRFKSVIVIPAVLVAAVGVFYGWLAITHSTISSARIDGLLLGPFPQGVLWKPPTLALLDQVNWRVVFMQGGQIGLVLVVSVIALLLNAGGIELATHKDMDLNRELRSAGIANLVAGFFGSVVGYHYLGNSVLAHRMGARNLVTTFFASLIGLLVLLLGASTLSYIPKFMVGGLLLFLGLSFLAEWVYDAWFKLPHLDYALVLVILGIIAVFGFLQGVGVGMGIALLLFVVKYSRVNVVKHVLTGASYHSTVDRPLSQRQLLREKAERLFILQLQGYIFFGTAQVLLDRIRSRLAEKGLPNPGFIILDFRRVSGFDSSAVSTFIRLKQLAEGAGIRLVFTQLSDEMTRQLEQGGFDQSAGEVFRAFPSLDYGTEWCEEQLLAEVKVNCGDAGSLVEQLRKSFTSSQLTRFMNYLEKMDAPAGYRLFRQGDPSDALFLIESGSAMAQLELKDGRTVRLRTMLCGTIIGEVGIYLENVRTASVVTAENTTLYRLSTEVIHRIEQADPDIAVAMHRWIAQLMADRLAENNNTLIAILD